MIFRAEVPQLHKYRTQVTSGYEFKIISIWRENNIFSYQRIRKYVSGGQTGHADQRGGGGRGGCPRAIAQPSRKDHSERPPFSNFWFQKKRKGSRVAIIVSSGASFFQKFLRKGTGGGFRLRGVVD